MADKIKMIGLNLAAILMVQLLFLGVATPVAEAQALPKRYQLSGVPVYAQQHNLSCEYSAASMVIAYWGYNIGESHFIKGIPLNANPHLGFRGNIDGSGGGIKDYGIYAEPIARYLQSRGFDTWVFYGGVDNLKREIVNGHPVMVWVTIGLGYAEPVRVQASGSSVKLVPGEHSVVVTGYDEYGVFVNGPAEGSRVKFGWSDFLRSWSYFDQTALSIW